MVKIISFKAQIPASEASKIRTYSDIFPAGYKKEESEHNKGLRIQGTIIGLSFIGGGIVHKLWPAITRKTTFMKAAEDFGKPLMDFFEQGHKPLTTALKKNEIVKGMYETIKYPVKGLLATANCFPGWAKAGWLIGLGLTALGSAYLAGKRDEKYNISGRLKAFQDNISKKNS